MCKYIKGVRLSNGTRVSESHGSIYGRGVYTTKVPLYAQLYATPERWRGKYVQCMFLLRQDPKTISAHGTEGTYTTTMIGRDDLHKLYGGGINENEMQFLTTKYDSIIIQALLIKIHDTDPLSNSGEYKKIADFVDSLE